MKADAHDEGFGFRIGCDVGGTFTDAVLYDEANRKFTLAKVPTTPKSPEVAVIEAIKKVLREGGIQASQVGYFCHATTIAVNALIGQENLDSRRQGSSRPRGSRMSSA